MKIDTFLIERLYELPNHEGVWLACIEEGIFTTREGAEKYIKRNFVKDAQDKYRVAEYVRAE